eukprot:2414257-Pyramimonas_sp.AAC.2
MKKPVRRIRRMVRRTLEGKGKGRSQGKVKRRRLRGTAGIHQVKVRDDEEIRRMPTVNATVHNISDASSPRAMEEAGVRQYIWLKRTPTCSASIGGRFWPTLLTAQPQ